MGSVTLTRRGALTAVGAGLVSSVARGEERTAASPTWNISVNGRVRDLARTGEILYGVTNDGVVFRIDAARGEKDETGRADAGQAYSTVGVGPETVAVGTPGGTVHKYTRDLSQELKLPLAGDIKQITVTSESILVAAEGTLYALSETGQELWQRELNGPLTEPTVRNGTVYVQEGLQSSDVGTVYAFELQQGTEQWQTNVPTTSPPYDPGFSDGLIKLSPDGTTLVARASDHGGEFADGIAVIDAADGTLQWTKQVANSVGATDISDRRVFTGNEGLTAYDRSSGDQLWQVDDTAGGVAYDSGTVYYAHIVPQSYDPDRYRIRALDAETRVIQWETERMTGYTVAGVETTPRQYVQMLDDRIRAFELVSKDTGPTSTAPPSTDTTPSSTDRADDGPPTTDTETTTRPAASPADSVTETGSSPAFLHPDGGYLTGPITPKSANIAAVVSALAVPISAGILWSNLRSDDE